MFLTLLGTVVLGLTAAGVLYALFHTFKIKAGRWLIPMSAGLAMLGFHLWNEYSWYPRTAGDLPEHVVVAGTYTGRNAMQFWTYIVPRVDRFSAVNMQSLRRHPEHDDLVMTEVYLVGRYTPTAAVTQLYDCDQPRRLDIAPDSALTESGLPADPAWVSIPSDDPIRQKVCTA